MPDYVFVRTSGGIIVRQGGPRGLQGIQGPPGPGIEVFPDVASEAAMLALDATEGDIAIRTDEGATYIHNGGTSGTVADWEELPGGIVAELDTDGTLAANSDTRVSSQKAVKTYADALLNAANAVQFKGAIDCSANPNYPAADAGHLYRVSVAGKIGGASGPNVEQGDELLCITDASAAGNQATVGANWIIGQANVDGAVIGPASATDEHFARFNGTSGKLIEDSGIALDTDDTLAADSDIRVPSQAAVKGYVDAEVGALSALPITTKSADYSFTLADLSTPQGFAMDVASKKFRVQLEADIGAVPAWAVIPEIWDLAGGLAISPDTYVNEVIADSPALYWRLGESSGTNANDETANNRDGTYVGTPTLAAAGALNGDSNTAVDLDGTDDCITSTYDPFAADTIRTFEGWAYRDTSSGIDAIFGGDTGSVHPVLRLASGSNDVVFFPAVGSAALTWAAAWPGNGQWVHWVLVFNESAGTLNGYSAETASLYINGALVSSQAIATAYNLTSGNFCVGKRGAAADFFDGKHDEIAVYESGLSAARIKLHYDAGKIRFTVLGGSRQSAGAGAVMALKRYAANHYLLAGQLA